MKYLMIVLASLIVGWFSTSAEAAEINPTPSTSDPAQTDCPTADFMDVSTFSHDNYPDPFLNVACDADSIIIQSNGIPNFEFVPITPNGLAAQNYQWDIPLNPTIASQPTDIPLLGPIAVAVNGIPIFGPTEAPQTDYADPFLDQILDYCNGHTAQRGDYHYHARPDCLFEDMEGNPQLVLAYSFDGFPIMAPFVCLDASCTQVKELQSSWQRTQDVRNAWEAHQYIAGSGDLDQCNGMVGADGQYRYYATDTFPYFLGCYMGNVDGTNTVTAPGAGQGQGASPQQNNDQAANVPAPGGQAGQGDGQRPPRPGGNNGNQPPPPGGGNGGQRPPRPGGGN